ncbi:MAG: winged helix-turn-helix domain-containing protein [Trichloromonadaceae bacterium]
MGRHFQLADEDLMEMLLSGKQTTFKNRVAWYKAYLSKALLLESSNNGPGPFQLAGQEKDESPMVPDLHCPQPEKKWQDTGRNLCDQQKKAKTV